MANTEQSVDGDVRGVWLSFGAPILGLVLLVTLMALLLLAGFASRQDAAFRETTHRLVSSALDARGEALADLTLDYADWDAAHEAVNLQFDRAWLEENFYSSVSDALIVFRPGDPPRFTWVDDAYAAFGPQLTREAQVAASSVYRLDRLVRAETDAGMVARSAAMINGQLALLAIAPVAPEDDAARRALDTRRAHYLINVALYDAEEIAALGQSLALQGLALAPPGVTADSGQLSLPIAAANGAPVGRLVWTDERPGSAVLLSQLWIVIPSVLLAGLLAFLCARRLVRRQINAMVHAESALETGRLKAGFIAAMSHELRTPLNAIIGYAEMIEEDADAMGEKGDSVRQDAARILVASRQLSRLVNDILDQSRLDAGRLPLKPETLDARTLVNEAAEAVAPAAQANGARTLLSVAEGTPNAFADHARLHQCLVALSEHAVRSTRSGVVMIAAAPHDEPDGRAFVAFEVRDSAVAALRPHRGVTVSPLPLADAHGRDHGGAPLGLALARKLARAMGGELIVSNTAGKGSILTLRVPAAPDSERQAA